jgi:hypothetical protein
MVCSLYRDHRHREPEPHHLRAEVAVLALRPPLHGASEVDLALAHLFGHGDFGGPRRRLVARSDRGIELTAREHTESHAHRTRHFLVAGVERSFDALHFATGRDRTRLHAQWHQRNRTQELDGEARQHQRLFGGCRFDAVGEQR